MRTRRRLLSETLLAASLTFLVKPGAALADKPIWDEIRRSLFGDRELQDGKDVIALEAPYRAYDAAVVPVKVQALIPQTSDRWIKTIHLVVDENPAPIAAVFHIAENAGSATIETRVRVNAYTNMHAVAETSDGQLFVAERFVKAAGGCSAPAMKDAQAAMQRLGKMKLKTMTAFAPNTLQRAQLLISHPNYTGMQMDQLSRNWIPPDYVTSVQVDFEGQPVLQVEGDISLSEDPSITFSFMPDRPGTLNVKVSDSEGRNFEQRTSIGDASAS